MKIRIAHDSPANRAGLSCCEPSFDPEHICSVVTKLYRAALHSEAGAIGNAHRQREMLDLVRDIYEVGVHGIWGCHAACGNLTRVASPLPGVAQDLLALQIPELLSME